MGSLDDSARDLLLRADPCLSPQRAAARVHVGRPRTHSDTGRSNLSGHHRLTPRTDRRLDGVGHLLHHQRRRRLRPQSVPLLLLTRARAKAARCRSHHGHRCSGGSQCPLHPPAVQGHGGPLGPDGPGQRAGGTAGGRRGAQSHRPGDARRRRPLPGRHDHDGRWRRRHRRAQSGHRQAGHGDPGRGRAQRPGRHPTPGGGPAGGSLSHRRTHLRPGRLGGFRLLNRRAGHGTAPGPVRLRPPPPLEPEGENGGGLAVPGAPRPLREPTGVGPPPRGPRPAGARVRAPGDGDTGRAQRPHRQPAPTGHRRRGRPVPGRPAPGSFPRAGRHHRAGQALRGCGGARQLPVGGCGTPRGQGTPAHRVPHRSGGPDQRAALRPDNTGRQRRRRAAHRHRGPHRGQ